jgi:hypothetical protein
MVSHIQCYSIVDAVQMEHWFPNQSCENPWYCQHETSLGFAWSLSENGKDTPQNAQGFRGKNDDSPVNKLRFTLW